MKDCRSIQKRLGPFMDKEVSDREKALIDTHLASCRFCKKELGTLKNLAQVLTTLEVAPAPLFIGSRIMARAREPRSFWTLPIWPKLKLGAWGSIMPQWICGAALACGLIIGSLMGVSSIGPMKDSVTLVSEHRVKPCKNMNDFLCGIHPGALSDLGGLETIILAVMRN